MVFVPLLQHAINVRARDRILVKREISGAIADNGHGDATRHRRPARSAGCLP